MDKLVVADIFFNLQDAHLAKGLLESAGIECCLFDESAAAYTPLVVGGIRLMVHDADLEQAKEILKDQPKEPPAE